MTMKNKEALIARLKDTIEHLEDIYSESRTPANERSIDYEFGHIDLRLGDLKAILTALTQPEQEWYPIATAPRDKRLLVRTELETYCAHWAKSPYTDDEAWIIAEWGDEGDQALVYPIEWRFIE